MTDKNEFVTCEKCGWVSYAVTREDAEREVARFNEYYDQQPPEVQAQFGGPSSLSRYRCMGCNGTGFRQAKANDCPDGCTISPVIYP